MALMAPMVNMKKLLDANQVAIIASTEAKAAETQAHVTAKTVDTKNSVLADNAANLAAANSNTDTKTAALGVALDSITTVNGNISTEVQAINGNTDAKIAEVQSAIAAKGVIKSIQRGASGGSGYSGSISIAPVNPDKSFLVVSGMQKYSSYSISAAGDAVNYSIDISNKRFSWEVIEYV